MKIKSKNRETKIAQKHLRHCEIMSTRQPKNKYWRKQVYKTRKILGIHV